MEFKRQHFISIGRNLFEIDSYRGRLRAMIEMARCTTKREIPVYYKEKENLSSSMHEEDTIRSDYFMDRYGNIFTVTTEPLKVGPYDWSFKPTLLDCAKKELK